MAIINADGYFLCTYTYHLISEYSVNTVFIQTYHPVKSPDLIISHCTILNISWWLFKSRLCKCDSLLLCVQQFLIFFLVLQNTLCMREGMNVYSSSGNCLHMLRGSTIRWFIRLLQREREVFPSPNHSGLSTVTTYNPYYTTTSRRIHSH